MKDRFAKHLNKIFSSYQKNDKIMDFKEELLGSLMDRYNELNSSGMASEESYLKSLEILDGIKDTIKSMETEVVVKVTDKYLLPAMAYWLSVVLVFLAVSFSTTRWDITWMIIVGGALVFGVIVCYKLSILAKVKGMKLLSRGNLLGAIIFLALIVYLSYSFASHKWAYSWITFIIALLVWYLLDVLLRMKEKKGVKITVFDAIIVTVMVTLIIYVLVSFIGGLWATSWLIFIVMALIIIVELMLFKSHK